MSLETKSRNKAKRQKIGWHTISLLNMHLYLKRKSKIKPSPCYYLWSEFIPYVDCLKCDLGSWEIFQNIVYRYILMEAIFILKNYIFAKSYFKDIPLRVQTFSHPFNVPESEKIYENWSVFLSFFPTLYTDFFLTCQCPTWTYALLPYPWTVTELMNCCNSQS